MFTNMMYVPALNGRRCDSPSVYRAPPQRTSNKPDASAKKEKHRSPRKRISSLFKTKRPNESGSRKASSLRSSKARLAKCRRKASGYFDRMFGLRPVPNSMECMPNSMDRASPGPTMTMDGTTPELTTPVDSPETTMDYALPNHRTATPLSPAIRKTSSRRRLFGCKASCDSQESLGPPTPVTQRSVRFYGVNNMQLDGPGSSPRAQTMFVDGSRESDGRENSHKMSERIEALAAKFNGESPVNTVVHRSKARMKPFTPFINTTLEAFPDFGQNNDKFSPNSSSAASGRDANSFWSPKSTTSTAATSFTSPVASRYGRTTPDDVHHSSKGFGNGEESALPPIEEDSRRFLLIPVQDATNEGVVPSIATVENTSAAKCALELHFNNLLMSGSSPRSIRRKKFEQHMRDLGLPQDDREMYRKLWFKSESDHLRQMRILKSTALARRETKGISIIGFDMVRVLGRGSFGVVRLVTERRRPDAHESQRYDAAGMSISKDNSTTNVANMDGKAKHNLPSGKPISDMFAMKVIRKSEMLRSCQEGHLRAERDFLVAAEGSTWVVPLLASFQDNTNLYLVMEYMLGGDFLGMLLREDVLDEMVARWYVAEMILCIEEAHKMEWIHRDIKPDNFLISASGHLKISDFGLAFNGHWAHNQSYYNGQRDGLLERIGINIKGDEQDVLDDIDAEKDGDENLRRPMAKDRKHDAEEGAQREGLLNWRNRVEKRRLARSIVGTSQYMAPEVILGQPYDGRCD